MLQPEIADIIHNCRICHNLMQGVFHQIFIKGNVFRIIPPELFDVAVKTVALPRLGAAEMNDGSLRADGLIVQYTLSVRAGCRLWDQAEEQRKVLFAGKMAPRIRHNPD